MFLKNSYTSTLTEFLPDFHVLFRLLRLEKAEVLPVKYTECAIQRLAQMSGTDIVCLVKYFLTTLRKHLEKKLLTRVISLAYCTLFSCMIFAVFPILKLTLIC